MERKDFRERVDNEYADQRRESDSVKPDWIWLNLILEELGEVAQDVNNDRSPLHELVQVVTLIEAWVEHRENWK